jgi:transcriptional regulator with GAF, ATPase, and Fis domain
MPRELIESELFGHVRGAFSGATKDKRGLFMEANKGTLLLDEIGELSPELQVKINRALQEREIRRVGDTVSTAVDVRIIASTNRDLKEAMEEGEFREDLYYRLNVFPLRLPPLRHRREDIPALVGHFLRVFAGESAPEYQIEQAAIELLMSYPWPGNVRELQNAVERAVVLCDDRRITRPLFSFLDSTGGESTSEISTMAVLPYKDAMDHINSQGQRQYLTEVLRRCGGNVTKAARHAGIERESFHRLMRKCGINADDIRREMSPD